MELLAILLSVCVSLYYLRILSDRTVLTSAVDLNEVLIYDTTCTNVKVTYLRVTHLTVRKTYVLT